MAGAVGREIVAAFKKYGTWRTVSGAPGAGDGLLIRSLSGQARQPQYFPSDEAGLDFVKRHDRGAVPPISTDLSVYPRYEGLAVLFALAMGIAGAPIQTSGGLAYYNTYQLATRLDGLFGSLFVKKAIETPKVWEYTSVKVVGFTLTSEAGKPADLLLHLVANDVVIDSPVSLASVTLPTLGNRIMGQEGTTRLNAQSGSALASGDIVQPNKWVLTYKRPVDTVHVEDGNDTIIEPVETGFPALTLTMDFPRYNDANHPFFANLGANTPMKGDITFLGALIETSNPYTFRLRFPHLVLSNAQAAISGPGIIPVPLQFEVDGAESAPSGMSGLVKPFDVFVQNRRSSDPLA